MPVLFSLIFICFESTSYMAGSHTQVWVDSAWLSVLGKWHFGLAGVSNFVLRKVGHFFGYGIIGLLFHRAWYCTARLIVWVRRSWLMPLAALLAVVSTFLVASLDEFHQTFLTGRVGTFHDVMLDTGGAILLNVLFWAVRSRYYKKLLHRRQSDCKGRKRQGADRLPAVVAGSGAHPDTVGRLIR